MKCHEWSAICQCRCISVEIEILCDKISPVLLTVINSSSHYIMEHDHLIHVVVAPASNLGEARGSKRISQGAKKWKNVCKACKNLLFLSLLSWNCQIWPNFNTFVIILGDKLGRKKIFWEKCPHVLMPPVALPLPYDPFCRWERGWSPPSINLANCMRWIKSPGQSWDENRYFRLRAKVVRQNIDYSELKPVFVTHH